MRQNGAIVGTVTSVRIRESVADRQQPSKGPVTRRIKGTFSEQRRRLSVCRARHPRRDSRSCSMQHGLSHNLNEKRRLQARKELWMEWETDEAASTDAVMNAIDELLESWQDIKAKGNLHLRPRKDYRRTVAQVSLILALTHHLYELAKVLRPHLPSNLQLPYLPIARAALETGMTVIWIDQVPDAAEASLNERNRMVSNMIEELRNSSYADSISDLSVPEWEVFETESTGQARHFRQLLERIGNSDAYVLYRELSGLVHPGVRLADEYLSHDADSILSLTADPPVGPHSQVTAHLLAILLLGTARVVNYLDRDQARRHQLRRIGKTLGVDPDEIVRAP